MVAVSDVPFAMVLEPGVPAPWLMTSLYWLVPPLSVPPA